MASRPLRILELCAGYGGFSLAFRLTGLPAQTVCYVEKEAHASATLVARMEEQILDSAPIWDDLRSFDGTAWRGKVDIITAGFPCQPFSSAGKGKGVSDERWLWPDISRIIYEVGPRLVFLENVRGVIKNGLPEILNDLTSFGYDAEWDLFSASEVGANHNRQRFWLLAVGNTSSNGHRQIDRSASEKQKETWRGEKRTNFPEGSGDDVAHTNSIRCLQGDRSRSGTGRGRQLSERGGSENVADSNVTGRKQVKSNESRNENVSDFNRSYREIWPPGRDDYDGWSQWIANGGPEPLLRRVSNGPPEGLADALHLGGNGLVPRVAAEAFTELAIRLDIGVKTAL